jgi:hypothetical protein
MSRCLASVCARASPALVTALAAGASAPRSREARSVAAHLLIASLTSESLCSSASISSPRDETSCQARRAQPAARRGPHGASRHEGAPGRYRRQAALPACRLLCARRAFQVCQSACSALGARAHRASKRRRAWSPPRPLACAPACGKRVRRRARDATPARVPAVVPPCVARPKDRLARLGPRLPCCLQRTSARQTSRSGAKSEKRWRKTARLALARTRVPFVWVTHRWRDAADEPSVDAQAGPHGWARSSLDISGRRGAWCGQAVPLLQRGGATP